MSKRTPTAITELTVSGMTCSNCARHALEALQELPSVASAGVLLEKGRATVRWRTRPDVSAAIKALADAGHEAKLIQPDAAPHTASRWSPLTSWRATAVIGLICLVPLMLGEWVFHLAMERWFQWLGFVLSSVVQLFCGARFYRGAWNQLKIGASNMDTLVALGSTTAYVFSVWVLLSGQSQHVYFMEAAGIITLISVGHWLEGRASAKASSALEGLLQLAPQSARQRDPQTGAEQQVPVADLQENDIVILKPGDRVPIDGAVIEGASAVDESMLTGESLPADKQPGDSVYAGTVNVNGQLALRVIATGEETALASVIAAVQRAQTSRTHIQRLGDRVSSVFVPIVVATAIGTALWWGLNYDQATRLHEFVAPRFWMVHLPETAISAAFIFAAAVLIVACPCAMGLATPVAIMAGTNAAARRGILIRDGIALEKAGHITAVLFDKTGTLTAGKPAVVQTKVLRKISTAPEFEIELAAALARRSNHPLSQTVAKLASRDFAFSNWQELRGAGVQAGFTATTSNMVLRLGSLPWLKQSGIIVNPAKDFSEEWMARGTTILGLAANQELVAVLALQDTLKAGADTVVAGLRKKRLRVYLITGDNKRTAAAIAQKVGIAPEDVFAEVRPEQKAILVKELQQRGEKVAFVGDGINDAPALEQADLGIAVSKASDIAHEASDIILLNSDIQAIPETLALASATLRTIKQNLFWAFFYNAAAIPLAAVGLMSPILCAAAMGLSDLVVIGNALRLRHRKFQAAPN